MTNLENIHYHPITKVAAAIERGDVSPVEVTEALLSRIQSVDSRLKSFVTVTADLAREQAKAAQEEIRKGKYRGPLHGIPIAVKDLCFTEGIRTTGGMTIYENFEPDYNATVVKKLNEAGAVLIGKLRMTEGATAEHHPELPEPVNPWKSDLWTGGSSSGSGVAPAAGLCFASIGSDTAGSIRIPTACNALTGVKPTYGRVSRHGIFDLSATFDHLGPMARSAADAAIMLRAVAGHDPADPTSLASPVPDYFRALDGIEGAQGVMIGLDWDFIGGVEPYMLSLIKDAIATLIDIGAKTRAVSFPDPEPILKHTFSLLSAETAFAHADTYPSQASRYGGFLRKAIEASLASNPVEIAKGNVLRHQFKGALMSLFSEIDILVVPVMDQGTPTWTEARRCFGNEPSLTRFTMPFNASGNPTVTLPCGYSDDGRPVAFQLVGAHGAEALILKAAHAYQMATDHHLRRPPGL